MWAGLSEQVLKRQSHETHEDPRALSWLVQIPGPLSPSGKAA